MAQASRLADLLSNNIDRLTAFDDNGFEKVHVLTDDSGDGMYSTEESYLFYGGENCPDENNEGRAQPCNQQRAADLYTLIKESPQRIAYNIPTERYTNELYV